MEKKELELLKRLSECNGISGYETEVSRLVKKELENIVDEIDYDNLGSIIGIKKGTGSRKIMLSGHIDEVGFIVKSIDEKGFIRVHPIGGWWPHVLLCQRMEITTRKNQKIIGVFGGNPPHGMSPEEKAKVADLKSLFLDVGATSREEVEKAGISIGDMVTPASKMEQMLNPKILLGKAWDDRIGIFIAIEVAKGLKGKKHEANYYAVGTVQEEVGLRGARTAASKINPDVALAIDVTITGDTPSASNGAKLGSGILFSLADSSVIGHRGLLASLEELAKEMKLPYAFDVLAAGGTDSGEIHKVHDGVPCLTISIPSRYIHSHNSIINIDDVENVIKLITEFIVRFNEQEYQKIVTNNR